jgi:biopolymer transport protein ExbB
VPEGMVQQAIVMGCNIRNEGRPNLRKSLDDAFAGFDGELKKFAIMVGTIIGVSPLLGLLGTVTGMIETFDSLTDNALFSQSGGVAGGISQALLTTQVGLAVAIPGILVQGVLSRKQRQIELELNQVKDVLTSMPDNKVVRV